MTDDATIDNRLQHVPSQKWRWHVVASRGCLTWLLRVVASRDYLTWLPHGRVSFCSRFEPDQVTNRWMTTLEGNGQLLTNKGLSVFGRCALGSFKTKYDCCSFLRLDLILYIKIEDLKMSYEQRRSLIRALCPYERP